MQSNTSNANDANFVAEEIDLDYAERLFAWVYCDLGKIYELVNPYTDDQLFEQFNIDKSYAYLNIARLLRQLINDGTPLVDFANRRSRLKILYFVTEFGIPNEEQKRVFEKSRPDVPDSGALPPGIFWKPVKRDAFLSFSSITLGSNVGPVSNGEIIDYFADCAGGVHLGRRLDAARLPQLRRFDSQIIVNDVGIVQTALKNMSIATLRALAPLKRSIERRFNGVEGARN